MTSADFSRQALLRDCKCSIAPATSVRPPRVLTRSFPPCPHQLYYAGFRAVIGLRLVEQPYPPDLALTGFYALGQRFACIFLQTLPHDNALDVQLYPSHCRADSGLSPVRTCARRAHSKTPPFCLQKTGFPIYSYSLNIIL